MATSNQLRMLSDRHVQYEITSMVDMYKRLPRCQGTEWNDAVLECFLLHARVLLDFFYPKDSPRRSDVFAFHFVEGGKAEWEKRCPRDSAESIFGHDVQDLYSKISTSIGHLSLQRLDKVAWNYSLLYGGLSVLIGRWTACLSDDARALL